LEPGILAIVGSNITLSYSSLYMYGKGVGGMDIYFLSNM